MVADILINAHPYSLLSAQYMNKIILFLLGIFTGLLAAGLILLVSDQPRGKAVELPPLPTPAPVLVYISGEVTQPGTYSLPPGSRVTDAVAAAGGLTEMADSTAANMAAMVKDGQQIHFPPIQESIAIPGRFSGAAAVNVNIATAEGLESLPGIGEVTARAIIQYRDTYGAFEVIEDLLFVDGIGPAVLEEIRPFITVQ